MKTKTYILNRGEFGQLENVPYTMDIPSICLCRIELTKHFPNLKRNVKLTVSKTRQHRKGEFVVTLHPAGYPYEGALYEGAFKSLVPRISFRNVIRTQIPFNTAERVISDLKLNHKASNIKLYVSLTNIE